MAISDSEYNNWLVSSYAARCVLIEANVSVSGSETTRYLSNRKFVTGGGDTPSNKAYQSIICGGVKLTETLGLDSSATLSFGEIELDNPAGEFDSWLNDVWENRTVNVYYGDVSWSRSDFRLIFKGTFAGIQSRDRTKLNLMLRDSLQRLNSPVTDTKLGGSTVNKDRLIPLTFGECHNVSPLLANPTTHEYQVHAGAIESIIEVRDNGAPITVTPSISTGKFTLTNSPVGTITASVQGSKPSTYSNQIADAIKNLVKNYGSADNRLTDSDIDLVNFSAFAAANTAPIGLYLSDRTNLLDACQQLANSVGAQITMSRTGLLQLLRIDFPPSGTPVIVTKNDMVERQFNIDSREPVVAAFQIGYCRNYTVENNLQTAIPEEHKSLYEQEWLTVTQSDSAVATKYKLLTEPVMKETLLQTTATANSEASRRLGISKVQRTVYKFTGFSSLLNLTLGQAITIKHDRFGLSGGATGVVVGLEPDWINGRIGVKVMI